MRQTFRLARAMAGSTVTLVIEHRTQPGQRDAVQAARMTYMAPAVAANPGHLSYTYCLAADDPDGIIAVQVYSDAAAAAAFLQTQPYLDYERAVAPLLLGPPQVRRLIPVWSKSSAHATSDL